MQWSQPYKTKMPKYARQNYTHVPLLRITIRAVKLASKS